MKRIAILGVPGSFHDIAAHKFFQNEEIELICCDTFEEVFENIRKDSGVIGMEVPFNLNSTYSIVLINFSQF